VPKVEWNALLTLKGERFRQPLGLLSRLWEVERSDFFNVLALRVADPTDLLERLRADQVAGGELTQCIGRVLPAQRRFTFQSPAEFEEKARAIVLEWAPRLAGKSFHLRLHRRGCKGELSTLEEERLLSDTVLEELERRGTPARIAFDDPDAVIDVETLGHDAGVSLWDREELARYPLLRVD
jgi:tRNA(Ser,Leu) C12 N-acetylase TAN1